MPAAGQLEGLLEEYGDRVLRFCRICLADEQETQAAVQEIFCTVAKNSCAQTLCESRVLGTALRVCAKKALVPQAAAPGLLGGIQGLCKKEKLAVLARYYLGLSEPEAAHWLRLPAPVFSARLRRGEKALHQHLKQ